MNEGMAYEVEIKYWRSAHAQYHPKEDPFLFVRWQASKINQEKINPFYLF